MTANPFATVWFYNSVSGAVISETALGDTIQSHLPGWHGPFGTKAEALDYYTANKAANPGWKAPAGLGANITNTVGAGASGILGQGFKLTFGNTSGLLGRILKVGVGLVLIVAGILRLTGTDKKLAEVLPIVGGPAGKVLAA